MSAVSAASACQLVGTALMPAQQAAGISPLGIHHYHCRVAVLVMQRGASSLIHNARRQDANQRW
jgi:hypothetical protein